MAIHLRQKGRSKSILRFDSVEGFDEAIKIDLELGGAGLDDKKVGGLSDTSVEFVESKPARFQSK